MFCFNVIFVLFCVFTKLKLALTNNQLQELQHKNSIFNIKKRNNSNHVYKQTCS